MGLRSSKHSPKSYDIAPVVSDKEISYTRKARPLPEIVLPAVREEKEEIKESEKEEINESEKDVKSNGITNNMRTADTTLTHNLVDKVDEPVLKEEPLQPEVEKFNEGNVDSKENNDTKEKPAINEHIPSWVNQKNFIPVLLKTHSTFKEIITFKAFPALTAGENYATLMLRVQITFKLQNDSIQEESYMLKVAHDTEQMKQMLQQVNFFITENTVYNDVLPEMEEMYRQAGVNVELAPKSHRLADEAPKDFYVLLEDLSVRGFKNVNRLECLDMEHTLAVLRKLAQYHAASACRVVCKGPYPAVFSPALDNEVVRAMIGQMFGAFKKPFLDNLPKYENGNMYYEKMNKYFDDLLNVFLNTRIVRPNQFNVLTHADAWSNNILFNYTPEGKLNDVLFVDFQNTHYGSVATDLFYFIISSARIDIKIKKFDYFIRYYHEHLVENLKLLEYPKEIPNLKELHMHMHDCGTWATLTAFLTMGVVLLDPTDNAKFENFSAEDQEGIEFKNKIFSNPRYIKYINEVLPWLYNRGFMDVNDLDSDIVQTDKAEIVEHKQTENSPMDCIYPEWVNEQNFNDIIRTDYENYQRIVDFVVSPATSTGDNHLSELLKVDIKIELTDKSTLNTSYMLKMPPSGVDAQRQVANLEAFVKEITAYNDILPQFEAVYKNQADLEIVFGPKSYKPPNAADKDTLVLENLKSKGFENSNRLDGLDMLHTKAALKKLAQFHAASAYVCETKGKFPAVYENCIFSEEFRNKEFEQFTEFYKLYYSCMKEVEGSEEYIEELKHILDNLFDSLVQAYKVDETKFNVLNHGDFWTNNIMFQHDDKGLVTDTYFVDFQLMKYGSPAYDLYYLLFTSTKLELKLEHFDYFIRYYHENLQSSLELLKYPKHIPTLRELHMELLEQGVWALYASITPLAFILLDPSDNASLNLLIKSDESAIVFKKKLFSHPRYRLHAEALFPWMSKRGLLTVNLPTLNTLEPTNNIGPVIIPSWLDAAHLNAVVSQDFENFDHILNITAVAATKPGDNYASALLRIKVELSLKDGSTANKSYILKLPVDSDYEQGMTTLWNFFDKEILMYSKYLQEFQNLYAEQGVHLVFGPKYYELSKDVGKNVLLMEDLAERQFKCGNRRQGFDMEHTKCALRKMAQFHAASVKYVKLYGAFPEIFQKGVYTEESREYFENIKMDFEYDYMKQFDNHELYIDKVPHLLENFWDNGIRCGKVNPTEFNVLNHADSWLNNIMFQHDEKGNIKEVCYIDYQACKYGSPAYDLWYFLISSTELDIKVASFDFLVTYYHEQLVDNLNLLKYNGAVPKLQDLHQMLLKYGHIGYSTFMGVGALCLLESNENANITNFIAQTPEGQRFRDSLFLNDVFKANAAVVLPWLAERGCMD